MPSTRQATTELQQVQGQPGPHSEELPPQPHPKKTKKSPPNSLMSTVESDGIIVYLLLSKESHFLGLKAEI